MAETAARVDMSIYNNATWDDAFQFGTTGDTSWSFTGMTFTMAVKGNRNNAGALLTLSSAGGSIVVDDVGTRLLHLNVPDTTIQADLPVGEYVYDLVMSDGSTPAIRTVLMQGTVCVRQGVTP